MIGQRDARFFAYSWSERRSSGSVRGLRKNSQSPLLCDVQACMNSQPFACMANARVTSALPTTDTASYSQLGSCIEASSISRGDGTPNRVSSATRELRCYAFCPSRQGGVV